MKGRDAGSHEYDIAAQYVAAQFLAQGLKPAGDDGGYLQRVPLVSYKAVEKGNFTLTGEDGQGSTLVFGEDYIPSADPSRDETMVSAPVVFVGYGIVAPTFARDDYAGVDVTGKIVAFFGGAPGNLPGEERAHFGSAANKAAYAALKGAGRHAAASDQCARRPPPVRAAGAWVADDAHDLGPRRWHRLQPGTGRAEILGTISVGGSRQAVRGKRR